MKNTMLFTAMAGLLFSLAGAGLPVAAQAALADCKPCHFLPNPGSKAPDYTAYFTNPNHHPSGIPYPASGPDAAHYKRPNARNAELAFFDRNGNGIADSDEIQLFGLVSATVECASCHREHGNGTSSAGPANHYLRGGNDMSRLCITCHQQ